MPAPPRYRVAILAVVLAAVAVIAVFHWPSAEGWQPCQPGETMSIVFVGDTDQGDQAEDFVAEHGYHRSFDKIGETIREGDFLVGNLETPITQDGRALVNDDIWHPRQRPQVAQVYADEGFDAFSLANNHIMDFGLPGLDDTLELLEAAGVRSFGAGHDEGEAREPLILEKDGVRVGILGYLQRYRHYEKKEWYATADTPGVALMNRDNLEDDIAALRDQVDAVVVFPHWGSNYKLAGDRQRDLARQAISAGADAILGHHAHMAQEVELMGGRPVLFSLGNFIWHARGSYKRWGVEAYSYTLVTRMEFGPGGVCGFTITPFFSDNRKVHYVPRPATADEARELYGLILAPLDEGSWKTDGISAVVGPPASQ